MRLRPPDLLRTRAGRLAAFFLLYVTEGIPYGFTCIAIATYMRRQGLTPGPIGAYIAALYLPWAFKWAVGPVVDTLGSEKHGRYRSWILLTQVGLIAALLAAWPVNFATQLGLFTAILVIHNVFGATQDVAIDALAVNVLGEHERGRANGFMFAGQSIGQAIGGSGVLFLAQHMPFPATYAWVAAAIALITLLVAVPMREPPGPPRAPREGAWLPSVGREMRGFLRETWRAFTGSRGAFLAVFFALLPTGAYALGLALQSNLAVDLGLDDSHIATLNLWALIASAAGCVAGGFLSDRWSRRWCLAGFIVLQSVPTAALALGMQKAGWIHPAAAGVTPPAAPLTLVRLFWTAVVTYNFAYGLMTAAVIALYMDVTTPRVAATQFTAYVALSNLCTSYSAWWQGWTAEKYGYPVTLVVDATVGLFALTLLPFIVPLKSRSR